MVASPPSPGAVVGLGDIRGWSRLSVQTWATREGFDHGQPIAAPRQPPPGTHSECRRLSPASTAEAFEIVIHNYFRCSLTYNHIFTVKVELQ